MGLGTFGTATVCGSSRACWMSGGLAGGAQNGFIKAGCRSAAEIPARVVRRVHQRTSSEADTGSDLSISCRAVLVGDEWVLNGNNCWCTFADGADYINVFSAHRQTHAPEEALGGHLVFPHRGKKRGEFQHGGPAHQISYFDWRPSSWP